MEHVTALRKLGPTPEEFEAYKKYPVRFYRSVNFLYVILSFQGDKNALSNIDQFIMKLMKIPNLKAKLDLLMTVYEFPLQVRGVVYLA